MQKEVHVLGPLLPSGNGIETQNNEQGASVDIEAFLGKMQVQHGKRSVFFVRFFPFFGIPTQQISHSDFIRHYLLSLSFGVR